MKIHVNVVLGSLLSLQALAGAQTNLLINGSFESGPTPGPSGDIQLYTGSTALPGWVVVGHSIDYVDSFQWDAADGRRSIDLDGEAPGGVQQTFATVPNTAYFVSFRMSANDGAQSIRWLRVSAAGQTQDFQFDGLGHSNRNMRWSLRTWVFLAAASSTTLRIASLSLSGSGGPALDDVRVTTGGAVMLPIGTGCAGSAGIATLTTNQVPRVGRPFSVLLGNLPLNQPAVALIGFSSQSWGSIPLPQALDGIGMTGCTLYTAIDIPLVIPNLGPFGLHVWGLELPSDPALSGLYFCVQTLIVDPAAANPARLVLTNAACGVVGT